MDKIDDLNEFRKEIDEIDSEILKLLGRRHRVVKKVKKYKKENNIEVVDLNREKIIFERLKKIAKKYELESGSVEDVFRAIISNSRKLQK
ncbi:chorismate mutase [archaeon]|jgi:chorismate mutase|nr:chorismate mutase [archaeon]MBT4241866.1 chorismate mutase [archaeon]MBT4418413.1 chorismate mutase [archaeon]